MQSSPKQTSRNQYSPIRLPKLEMPLEIRQFLEKLLGEAGLQNTAPELKLLMLNDLFLDLQNKLFLSLSQALSEGQLETYVRMAAIDRNQAMVFAREVLPNLDEIMKQAMEEFKQAFLQSRDKSS